MTNTSSTRDARFAITDHLQFDDGDAHMPVATIRSPHATAQVALQGAHVLAWQPTGHQPVLWVSKAAVFAPDTPIRGGVPVCWPWFGALPGKTPHGFVRTRLWEVRGSSMTAEGAVVLHLGIRDDAATRALWDQAFDLELVVTVGSTLTMALTTHNTGDAPFAITQALHTYFSVGDITQTTVQGLEGCHYLDKVQNFASLQQSGAVGISAETDRIYTDTTSDCLIQDAAWGRTIRVAKQGSRSTVVWNPWAEREKAISDMAVGEFQGMLCVETCNAGPDQIQLLPGESHTLSAFISVA